MESDDSASDSFRCRLSAGEDAKRRETKIIRGKRQ